MYGQLAKDQTLNNLASWKSGEGYVPCEKKNNVWPEIKLGFFLTLC